MNYINILIIILLITTLFVVGCSSDKEVPLAGDLGPTGGKVSLSIINPNADNLTNQTSQEIDIEIGDILDDSGIPLE